MTDLNETTTLEFPTDDFENATTIPIKCFNCGKDTGRTVSYDMNDLETETSVDVRRKYPRMGVTCPHCDKFCIYYHSVMHMLDGDW